MARQRHKLNSGDAMTQTVPFARKQPRWPRRTGRLLVAATAALLVTTIAWRAGPALVPRAEAGAVAAICGGLVESVKEVWNYCKDHGIGDCAAEIGRKGLAALKAIWSGIRSVWDWLKTLPGRVESWAGKVWDYISDFDFEEAIDFVGDKIAEIKQWIADLVRKVANSRAFKRIVAAFTGVGKAWNACVWYHPIDCAEGLLDALYEVGSALVAGIGALGSAAVDLGRDALNWVSAKVDQLKAWFRGLWNKAKGLAEEAVSAAMRGLEKVAKSAILPVAKAAVRQLVKRLMSQGGGTSGAGPPRTPTDRLAEAIVDRLEPVVASFVKRMIDIAKPVVTRVTGIAEFSGEALCTAAASAAGSLTAGLGSVVKPVCDCLVGVAGNEIRGWFLDLVSDKVLRPVVKKGLEVFVGPIASFLFDGLLSDLGRLVASFQGSAADVASKIQGLRNTALGDYVPATVWVVLAAGSQAAIEVLAREASQCLGNRHTLGFFGTLDCLWKSAGASARAGVTAAADKLIEELFAGPADALRERFRALKAGLARALEGIGVPMAADILEVLEGTAGDVLKEFARGAVGNCLPRILRRPAATGGFVQRISETLKCLGAEARKALKGSGAALVRQAVALLAEKAQAGAAVLGAGLEAVMSKLGADALSVIPQFVRDLITRAAQAGLDGGARKLSELLHAHCITLASLEGETTAGYARRMGACVLSQAATSLQFAGLAGLRELLTQAIQLFGKNVSQAKEKLSAFIAQFGPMVPAVASLRPIVVAAVQETGALFASGAIGCVALLSENIVKTMGSVARCLLSVAKGAFRGGLVGGLRQALVEVIRAIGSGAQGMREKVRSFIQQYRGDAPGIDALAAVADSAIRGSARKFLESAAACPAGLQEPVRETIRKVVECIVTAARGAFGEGALAALRQALASTIELFGRGVRRAKEALRGVVEKYAGAYPEVRGLLTVVDVAADRGKEKFTSAAAACPAKLTALTSAKMSEAVKCVVDAARAAFREATVEAVRQALRAFADAVARAPRAIRTAYGKLRQGPIDLAWIPRELDLAVESGLKAGAAAFRAAARPCPDKVVELKYERVREALRCIAAALRGAAKATTLAAVQAALRSFIDRVAAAPADLGGLYQALRAQLEAAWIPRELDHAVRAGLRGAGVAFKQAAGPCPGRMTRLDRDGARPALACIAGAMKTALRVAPLAAARGLLTGAILAVGVGERALRGSLETLARKAPEPLRAFAREVGRVLAGAVGAGASKFMERAVGCPAKLAALDGASLRKVVACLRDAARGLGRAATVAAAQGLLQAAIRAVARGAAALRQGVEALTRGVPRELREAAGEVGRILTGAVGTAASKFMERAVGCPAKLAALDGASLRKVVACLRDAKSTAATAARGVGAGALRFTLASLLRGIAQGGRTARQELDGLLDRFGKVFSALKELPRVLRLRTNQGAQRFHSAARDCPDLVRSATAAAVQKAVDCILRHARSAFGARGRSESTSGRTEAQGTRGSGGRPKEDAGKRKRRGRGNK
jgi:phage-related protein